MSRENLSSGFPTRWDSNQPAQLQKLARGLKFRIQKLEVLYYQGSKQQKCWSDRCAGWPAPLLVVYSINRFSHDMAHINSGTFLPYWSWGQGPLILGKWAGKSTKLGKLDQKKKEQFIYILTRFKLQFELNIWKIKHFVYDTQQTSFFTLKVLAGVGSHWVTRLPNSQFSSFAHPGSGFLDSFF